VLLLPLMMSRSTQAMLSLKLLLMVAALHSAAAYSSKGPANNTCTRRRLCHAGLEFAALAASASAFFLAAGKLNAYGRFQELIEMCDAIATERGYDTRESREKTGTKKKARLMTVLTSGKAYRGNPESR